MTRLSADPTVGQVRRRLRTQHARMGFEGRLSLTMDVGTVETGPVEGWFLTHWLTPDGSAYEDCRAVGHGSLEQCLAALERYASGYRRRPTAADLARTLGLTPAAGLSCVAAE